MRVILRKIRGRGASAIVGTIGRKPLPGHPVVVAFHDGIHEFITSTVIRVMGIGDSSTLYVQTRNSIYRMDISSSTMRELPPPASNDGDG
jgi:hypothetical protein